MRRRRRPRNSRGRLQDRRGQHAAGRRHREAGRMIAWPSSCARRPSSPRWDGDQDDAQAAHPNMRFVRLLPLLVGPEQIRGHRSASSRRHRPRALPGRPGHAPRTARPDHAGHSRRRCHAAGEDPAQAGREGYEGPLSVELFLPKFQQADPFEVAREIRQKSEAVMRQARAIKSSLSAGPDDGPLRHCLLPTRPPPPPYAPPPAHTSPPPPPPAQTPETSLTPHSLRPPIAPPLKPRPLL